MLLSRCRGAKLQGSLQLDMFYATISVFGQPKRLYRETLMKYVVSNQEKPQNFPIYSIHSDMDSFILYNADICHKAHSDLLMTVQTEESDEQCTSKDQGTVEIADNKAKEQDTPSDLQETNLPIIQLPSDPNPNLDHETLWCLEFDGSVNKLGAGAGVWIHNMHND